MGNSSSYPSRQGRCHCLAQFHEPSRRICYSSNGDRIFEFFVYLLPELKDHVLKQCTMQELMKIKQCSHQMKQLVEANIRVRNHISIKFKRVIHYGEVIAIFDSLIDKNLQRLRIINHSGVTYRFKIT